MDRNVFGSYLAAFSGMSEVVVPDHSRASLGSVKVNGRVVHSYTDPRGRPDAALLDGFAREWERFGHIADQDLDRIAKDLFDILPEQLLRPSTVALDIGCGGGRWSRWLSPHVGHIDAIDPGLSVMHAARMNADRPNIRWSQARAEDLPFADGSFHLALCIGVLHHLKDPMEALLEARRVLRPGGVFYFYVYYALEERGRLFKALFRASDIMRRLIHPLPYPIRYLKSQAIAALVYLPLVTLVRAMKAAGLAVWRKMPLAFYHDKSFRIMRNDALDRFGTSVENRRTRAEITSLLEQAGFASITFSSSEPFWHGSAIRK